MFSSILTKISLLKNQSGLSPYSQVDKVSGRWWFVLTVG